MAVTDLCSVCANDLVAHGQALPICGSEDCLTSYLRRVGNAVDAEYRTEEAQHERAEKHAGHDDKRARWQW